MKNILIKIKNIQDKKLVFPKTTKGVHDAKYCPLDKVREILHTHITENNLVVYHNVQNGLLHTTVYDIESGDNIVSSCNIQSDRPQEIGSAISYFKRYNLGCIFNVITDEDNDGKQAGKTETPKTLEKIKQILKQNGIDKTPQAEKWLSEKLGREIILKEYTEEQAQKDLITLQIS